MLLRHRWMGTAWSKVESDTIIKCFAAAGISSTFSVLWQERRIPLLILMSRPMRNWRILSNRLHLEVESLLTWSPITNFQPVTEQKLLGAIGTSHDVMEIESDDENGMEKEDTPGEDERSNETTMWKVSLATKWGKLQFKGEVHRAHWNDILRHCDSWCNQ